MQLNKTLVVIFCILRLNFADLLSCSKEVRKNEICLKTNETYIEPYPLALNTTVVLKEIIEINEKESSITVRVGLVTAWRDPRIGLSKGSTTG